MGFLDLFKPNRHKTAAGVPVEFRPTFMFTADEVADVVAGIDRMSPEDVYASQPDLRTVLDFRARNFAQIGMHAFARNDDGGRERDRGSQAARLLANPSAGMTWFELMWALCLDFDLRSATYLLYNPALNMLVHIPARRVTLLSGSWELGDFTAEIQAENDQQKAKRVDASTLIPFRLYNPGGKSPMQTLKDVLKEQAKAQEFRLHGWENGQLANRFISRPNDAPAWTPEARARFVEQMRAYQGKNGGAGGTPLLEDGMELKSAQFRATEGQVVEMAKLSRERCAAAYGVTLSMLGSPDGNSYANLKEYRRQLYGETLGPIFKMVEDRLNAFLLPLTDPGKDRIYIEFNVKERLRSDPVDQAKVYQASVGAPIMTRNEARARENLPAVDGGDELITPLNVALGAVASPQDTAPDKNPLTLSAGVEAKARHRSTVVDRRQTDVDAVQDILDQYFARQRRSVLSDLGAGRQPDYDRWQEELYTDLQRVMPGITQRKTRDLLAELDLEATAFQPASSHSIAAMLAKHAGNIVTAGIGGVLAADDPDHAFDVISGRAGAYADTIVTSTGNQRAVDVGVQGAKHIGGTATKMWMTTSGRARASHARMNGQIVPCGEPFSNGAFFPRESLLGPAEVVNCMCQISIVIQPGK